MTITLKKAVLVATLAMVVQRQSYHLDKFKFDQGIVNQKTLNAQQKYDQLTEAIALFQSLVVTTEDPRPAAAVTNE